MSYYKSWQFRIEQEVVRDYIVSGMVFIALGKTMEKNFTPVYRLGDHLTYMVSANHANLIFYIKY